MARDLFSGPDPFEALAFAQPRSLANTARAACCTWSRPKAALSCSPARTCSSCATCSTAARWTLWRAAPCTVANGRRTSRAAWASTSATSATTPHRSGLRSTLPAGGLGCLPRRPLTARVTGNSNSNTRWPRAVPSPGSPVFHPTNFSAGPRPRSAPHQPALTPARATPAHLGQLPLTPACSCQRSCQGAALQLGASRIDAPKR